jgi:uncharacterized membrane protein YqjE
MTTFQKDLAATVATALTALVFVATHEGWNVWLIGDSYRWAALVMTLLALVVLWFETTVRDAWHSTHHPMTA